MQGYAVNSSFLQQLCYDIRHCYRLTKHERGTDIVISAIVFLCTIDLPTTLFTRTLLSFSEGLTSFKEWLTDIFFLRHFEFANVEFTS